VAELRIRLGISPANEHEEGGRKSDRFESALLQTISKTFKCKGRILARTSAASVDVDLKRRLNTRAKGRCADLRAETTFFLVIEEAHTAQLYRIVGMKVVLYNREIVFLERPQERRQHFKIRNRSFFTAVHFFEMWLFQLSLSSIVRPRYRQELERGTIALSTTKDRMGKSRLEEKIIKMDLIPLKESLTERPHSTAASHMHWRLECAIEISLWKVHKTISSA